MSRTLQLMPRYVLYIKLNCRNVFFYIRDFHKGNVNQNLFSVDCCWSKWILGKCSVSCGDGVRENLRFKEQEEIFGGAPCEGVASQTEACINRICPGMHMCKAFIKILNKMMRELIGWFVDNVGK